MCLDGAVGRASMSVLLHAFIHAYMYCGQVTLHLSFSYLTSFISNSYTCEIEYSLHGFILSCVKFGLKKNMKKM
jgi:hypothetical protein